MLYEFMLIKYISANNFYIGSFFIWNVDFRIERRTAPFFVFFMGRTRWMFLFIVVLVSGFKRVSFGLVYKVNVSVYIYKIFSDNFYYL